MAENAQYETQINQFLEGQHVYISEQYYKDVDASFIEIPRFGWIVKSTLGNVATILYHRKNIKLNMTLSIDISYLHNEL